MHSNHDIPYWFKVLLLGDESAGKSSLFIPTEEAILSDYKSTIGLSMWIKRLEVENERVRLIIVEGSPEMELLHHLYFRSADGVILVYDIHSRLSFKGLSTWLAKVQDYCNERVKIALVGNTTDRIKKRLVSYTAGKKLAEKYPSIILFDELSVEMTSQIETLLEKLARAMINEKPLV